MKFENQKPASVDVALNAFIPGSHSTYSLSSVPCAPNSGTFDRSRTHLEPLPMQTNSTLTVFTSGDQGECFRGNYAIPANGKFAVKHDLIIKTHFSIERI